MVSIITANKLFCFFFASCIFMKSWTSSSFSDFVFRLFAHLPGWWRETRRTRRYNQLIGPRQTTQHKPCKGVEPHTLSLALMNVIWHISETGWVDRLLRFGPFRASPSSSTSRWLSQLTAWHWTWFLSPDFTLSLYFYLNRLSGTPQQKLRLWLETN